jgi:gas vesicle structural protein
MATVRKAIENEDLTDVIDRIIDRGITVEKWSSIAVPAIEAHPPYAAVLIAPVETYLHHAAALALTVTRPNRTSAVV